MRQDRRSGPEHRVNERIRATDVRVIGPEGEQLGILATSDAMSRAAALDLDLVEVAPTADPPVCRILDYGKFKYQESIRLKEAKKKQSSVTVKEVRFSPKIGTHDYDTKRVHIEKFLSSGARVKIIMRFRGREMAHTELGARVLRKLTEELEPVATVETPAKLDGRAMTMLFAPLRTKPKKGDADAKDENK